MAKFQSGKVLAVGAGLAGAYILFKVLTGATEGEPAPSGTLGGEDDLGQQQGFDIDPNTAYPVPYGDGEAAAYPTDSYGELPQSAPIQPIIPTAPTIEPTFYKDTVGETKAPDTSLVPNSPQVVTEYNGLFGTGISLPQYGLGVLGLTGSYFTALGEGFITGKKSLKAISKTGIESIPVVGKRAASFMDEPIEAGAKRAASIIDEPIGAGVKRAVSFIDEPIEAGAKRTIKLLSEPVVETGARYAGKKIIGAGAKTALKRTTKVGIGLIPFVGTVAGAEFDVAVGGRSRPLAYTANIVGDIVGGLAGAAGALFGGLPGIAGGIGGQIGGEQAVYSLFGGDRSTELLPAVAASEESSVPESQRKSDFDIPGYDYIEDEDEDDRTLAFSGLDKGISQIKDFGDTRQSIYSPMSTKADFSAKQPISTQTSISGTKPTIIGVADKTLPSYSIVSASQGISTGGGRGTAIKAGTQFRNVTVQSSTGQQVTMNVSSGFEAKLRQAIKSVVTPKAKVSSPSSSSSRVGGEKKGKRYYSTRTRSFYRG